MIRMKRCRYIKTIGQDVIEYCMNDYIGLLTLYVTQTVFQSSVRYKGNKNISVKTTHEEIFEYDVKGILGLEILKCIKYYVEVR